MSGYHHFRVQGAMNRASIGNLEQPTALIAV
jgi:hypothetical protein